MVMNDPHVRAIHYFVEHDDSIDYRDAAPLVCEDELFCIRADKSEVVIEPKNHYTTEEEAKRAVEGFVRRWEFEAAPSCALWRIQASLCGSRYLRPQPASSTAGRCNGRPRKLPVWGAESEGKCNQGADWVSCSSLGSGY